MKKTDYFLLEQNQHNFKVGDIIRVETNKVFDYKINAIKKWKGETILSITPTDKGFNDCNSLILTKYNIIYKKVLK